MELTYYTPGGSGEGGDQYTGLDRFGRVVNRRTKHQTNGRTLRMMCPAFGVRSKSLYFLFIMLTCICVRADPVTINSVNISVGATNCAKNLKAVQDYEKHPKGWEVTNLFDVAEGYLDQKKPDNAISILQNILSAQPTNALAMRRLGTCYFSKGNYDAAIIQFKQGWNGGDDMPLLNLANTYLVTSRISEIKSLVPDLLKVRSRMTDSDNKHEITNALILYSLKGVTPQDKGVFIAAIDGLSDDFILASKDTTALVIPGLKIFGYQDRANKLNSEIAKHE